MGFYAENIAPICNRWQQVINPSGRVPNGSGTATAIGGNGGTAFLSNYELKCHFCNCGKRLDLVNWLKQCKFFSLYLFQLILSTKSIIFKNINEFRKFFIEKPHIE